MMPDEPDNPVQEYFAAHAVHRRFGAAADVAAHSERCASHASAESEREAWAV